MNELSLFSGAGGGLLGTHLLGWRPIGYVEFNEYCQQVIKQRIDDGILPVAPIFGDIREFVESGAACEYRGLADVVTGGFPCQPFSTAGKRAGADDARNMWPATIATIRAVRPRYAFLENVPGILSSGYFGTILGDLAESGYDTRWRILSAAELGAPHKRDRLWIVGHTICNGWRESGDTDTQHDRHFIDAANEHAGEMAYSHQNERQLHQSGIEGQIQIRHDVDGGGSPVDDMGNTTSARLSNGQYEALGRSTQRGAKLQLKQPTWWATEP